MDDDTFTTHETHVQEDKETFTEFAAIIRLYKAQPAPHISYDDTTRLLKGLLIEETGIAVERFTAYHFLWSALRGVIWRLRLLGTQFWIVSVGLLFAGVLGAPFLPGNRVVSLLILCLPFTGLLGVASVLRIPSPGLREVENACPTSFVQMAVASVVLVTGIDCMVGLLMTTVMSLLHLASFIALLVTWLGPLLLLTGCVLLVALRWQLHWAPLAGGGLWLSFVGHTLLVEHDVTRAALLVLPHDQAGVIAYLCAGAVGILIFAGLFWRGTRWQQFIKI